MATLTRARSIVDDDVEAQHQFSDWLSKVKYTLRTEREEVEDELGFQILKVPEHHRQPPEEFTPLGWRLGLHNRENLVTTGSEALKLSFARALGLVGEKWIDFCNFVVHDAKSMLVCYGLHEGVSNLSEEVIKQVLALDALFLAVFMDSYLPENGRQLCTPELVRLENFQMFNSRLNRWTDILGTDMCRIENQVPFVLIERAIKYIRRLANPQHEEEDHPVSDGNDEQVHDPYLEKRMQFAVHIGMLAFIGISDDFYINEKPYPSLSRSDHILDAAYKAICGENGMRRRADWSQKEYIHIPSASSLTDSGINIVGVVGPVCAMKYENKCLFLPKMKMRDETVALVRNVARNEEYSSGDKCVLHDYVALMCDLIETPDDFKILTGCGVIDNDCGSGAFKSWNALNEGLAGCLSSKEHNEMKVAIKKRCELKRYRIWSEFRTLFCSRPWLVLSTFAVVLVTMATLIQTYIAVIGSNRMKPRFGP